MNNKIIYPNFKTNLAQLNKFISLRFEKDKTNIYINNKLFMICKALIFHIPVTELNKYDDITSIDDLEQESISPEYKRVILSPQDEFWGHCSNIQAWIENDYDTRILHHSIAFPLLRELSKLGNIKAKRIFKDEIISRFISGSPQVKLFLLEQNFLHDFNLEEREIINESLDELYTTSYFAKKYYSDDEISSLFDKQELSDIQKIIHPKEFMKNFTRKYDHLQPVKDIADIEELKTLTDITSLNLIQNYITEIKGLEEFTYLRELVLNMNEIEEIKNLEHLRHLRYLSLSGNHISKIKGLKNLTKLEFLFLGDNQIAKIEGLEHLRKLKVLSLWDNKINIIEGLENLTNLRQLALGGNQISEIKGLDNLKNLRILILNSNRISEIKEIENLTHLKGLYFYNNNIREIHDFPDLPELQEISLRMNPISSTSIKDFQKILDAKTKTKVFGY